MRICANCGESNGDRARFCSACGAALAPLDPQRGELRKTVTIVFCDLAGSTSLGERIDAESLRRVMARYYEVMRAALERHGGRVEKFIGDAVMAVFGMPVINEDDALRAVRAALDMKHDLVRLNEELERRWGVSLKTRTGVNTGEVVAGNPGIGESFVVGDAVNVAARLEQHAPADEILIGEPTYCLVRHAVTAEPVRPLEMKGKEEPVPARRLVSVARDATSTARHLDSPLVGRERELEQLDAAFARAVQGRRFCLATLLGPAGVGKTRLCKEFTDGIAERATVLRGRCLPYGEGITFWPLAEIVRTAAAIEDTDSPQVAAEKVGRLLEPGSDPSVVDAVAGAIGIAGNTARGEEIFRAVRHLLVALARRHPLVVVLEDIHWGEATFLDLVEYLGLAGGEAPVLVLAIARAELLEQRPGWAAGIEDAPTVTLSPLGGEDTNRLVAQLLGDAPVAEEVSARVMEAAGGNPLFVAEMVRMLVDDDLLQKQAGGWHAAGDLAEISVPPTVDALLAARLDRLEPGERDAIERASVMGQEFWPGALVQLTPEPQRGLVRRNLQALVRKELVRPEGQPFAGEEAYRFDHILIRDVAYGGLLKEARSRLHEDFADWLEGKVGERMGEYVEILGYHLEQGFRYREALGPVDAGGRRLASRAVRFLAAAGADAQARGDGPASVNLLDRSLGLIPSRDPSRLPLMLDLGQALFHVGDFDRADLVWRDAARDADAVADARTALRARLERADLKTWTDPRAGLDELEQITQRAIPVLEEMGDEAGLARAWRSRSMVFSDTCRWGQATEALERALGHAWAARDREVHSQVLGGLATALYMGPVPVAQAIERLEVVLGDRIVAGEPNHAELMSLSTRVQVESCGLASLMAMRGEFSAARALCTRAKQVVSELGHVFRLANQRLVASRIEVVAGDFATAERELRGSAEALREIGEENVLSTVAAELAEVVYRLGQLDGADELTHESERLAAEEDVETQVRWRLTRAKLMARRGDVAAERLAREAATLAADGDFLNLHGDALVALAEVLRLLGRPQDATIVAALGVEIYEAKGNSVSADQARTLLVEQPPETHAPRDERTTAPTATD
jgi:class 3 adenylate cyclase/tetratricopeptide (TPR) repeat protein